MRSETAAMAHGLPDVRYAESAFIVLAKDEPNSYKDAMNSPDAAEWRPACEAKYDILMGYHTWKLIKKLPSGNIVRCWWTFRVKRDNLGAVNKFKARLIAQGFSQVKGLDYSETFSPIIKFTTIRLMIALACRYNLELHHINIKGTYLNGKLEDDIYMCQPEGFTAKGEEHLVCKLYRSMYRLKQSGHVWHQTLKQGLGKLGFTAGETNSTVFFRFQGNSIKIVGWYVNDGLLATNSSTSMKKMVEDIGGSFDFQDLGEPERLLCIRVKHD